MREDDAQVIQEPTIMITEDFFNVIELLPAPSRWEGRREIYRGRIVERRRDGSVARDVTHDTGVVLIWPEPERAPWWHRLLGI